MNKYHADSPLIPLLLAGIEQNPGIGSKPLAALIGRSWSHVKKGLAFLNANKLAGYCELGKLERGWFLWEEAEKRNAGFMSLKAKSRLRASKRPPTARSLIEQMAATDEDGASTLKVSEMLGASEKDAHRTVLELVRRGRLFKASRRGFRLRWFATEKAAQHWESLPAGDNSEMRSKPGRAPQTDAQKEAAFAAARLAREERARQRMEAKKRSEKPKTAPKKVKNVPAIKAKPGNDAPVVLKGTPSDIRGAVDYSRAKRTIDDTPKFDHRYQLPPGAVVVGEFSRQWQQLRGQA